MKLRKYVIMIVAVCLMGACAKDGFWNNNSEVLPTQKGNIVGQLINDDDNKPLKGVKILFERQTQKDGGNTFVDTVSTDEEGKFVYSIPFPNKVRLAVRDTGRYVADTSFVEVLEHRDYPVMMNSHPRFGVMGIAVNVFDVEYESAFEGVGVSLLVRENTSESYSKVETLLTDKEGKIQFKDIAWPVHYKIRIEDTVRYQADSVQGKVTTKEPIVAALKSMRLFGETDFTARVMDTDKLALEGLQVTLLGKKGVEDEYISLDTLISDENGQVTFKNVEYPMFYKLQLAEHKKAYDYEPIESVITAKNPEPKTIVAKANIKKGDIRLKGWRFFQNETAVNEKISLSYKSILDEGFTAEEVVSFDTNGDLVLPNFIYPAEIRIKAANNSIKPFRDIMLSIDKSSPLVIRLNLFDKNPSYNLLTPSSNSSENRLVTFYDGLDFRSIETDENGNIFAVTQSNMLVRIPYDGASHKVLATGLDEAWGLAVKDAYTVFVVENKSPGGNKIKKFVIDPKTDAVSASILTGTGASGGTNGSLATATFNRPSDALYDSSRNCLWVTEWSGKTLRKVDLDKGIVSTAATGLGTIYSLTMSHDQRFIYIGGFSDGAGIRKLDLNDLSNSTKVISGGDIRYLAITPDDKLFYAINKDSNPAIYYNSITGVGRTIAAGNNTKGIPARDYKGPANVAIASGGNSADNFLAGIAYDSYSGRLYFTSTVDKRLYYIKLATAP